MAFLFKSSGLITATGTQVPVFLLDGTRFVLNCNQKTTVQGVCLAIRKAINIDFDAPYGLYVYKDGGYMALTDSMTIAKALADWTDEQLSSGSRRLYFKRLVCVLGDKGEQLQNKATNALDPHHRLVFCESVHHFLECNYRFPREEAMQLAALLLHTQRGDYDRARDSIVSLDEFVEYLVPAYLISDGRPRVVGAEAEPAAAAAGAGEPSSSGPGALGLRSLLALPRSTSVWAQVGTATGEASTKDQATRDLLEAYKRLPRGRGRFWSEKTFIDASKDFVGYGSDFFLAKRTWKETEQTPSEDEVKSRTEDVTVGVSFEGLHLTGIEAPLALETHEYEIISRWTVSRDGRVFAFQVNDQHFKSSFIVFLVTPHAADIERSLERFVRAVIKKRKKADPEPRARVPRAELPTLVRRDAEPNWVHADPERADARPDESAVAEWQLHLASGLGGLVKEEVVGVESGGEEGSALAAFKASSAAATPRAAAATTQGGAAGGGGEGEGGAAGGGGAGEGDAAGGSDNEELPAGWSFDYDEEGDKYYINDATGETQWEAPTEPVGETDEGEVGDLPAGWSSAQDDDGDTYFINEVTGETQWEAPTEPAEGAAEGEEVDDPLPLPPGWEALQDDDGDTYYAHDDGRTQWERPEE